VVEILKGVKGTIAALTMQGIEDGSVRPGHAVLTALSVISQPIYLTLVAPLLSELGDFDLTDPVMRDQALKHTLQFVRAGLTPLGETNS
jgi:hypothetical protein